MSFVLNDEQRAFRDVMHDFVDARIAPHAARYDREQVFPLESWQACQEMELPSVWVPEAYGGSGADMVTQAIMIEEIARGCASTAVTMLISKLAMMPIMNFASEQIKQQYLPRFGTGELQGSYCLSEADAGSDVASMRCRAVRDGDDYVLNGSKYWITNAGVSDTYTVFASTEPDLKSRGITCFLVEKAWGVKFPKFEDKLGLRASPTGEVVFDNVRVPASHRIGNEGEGFKIAMHTLARSRPTIGAQAVGISQGAIDFAGNYMQGRKQFGTAISEFQGLRFMLADMAIRTEAARALVYAACATIDAGDPDDQLGYLGAAAKSFASDTAMSVATDAVQLLGGYGFTKEFPVERFMRDAKITQIYEGTNQVQRIVVAKHLLK
jgi:alkylation response protein AidB-like acyl-CoA dehydrogenase